MQLRLSKCLTCYSLFELALTLSYILIRKLTCFTVHIQ
jgi:hypothetical protein